ncbi:hypothetical protein [Lactococcus ileimucosae]|uniref:hypothetical protein n=1 Tax=Lactococcus ileimucosae TaxID=2941329 RepID=UPI003517DCE2
MTDSNEVKKFERDSIKIAVNSATNLSEKIKLGQNNAAISVLADTLSNFQAAVNTSNISGFIAASNAISASKLMNIANLTPPLASLTSSIKMDKSAINAMSEVIASYNKILSSTHLQAIQNIAESAKNLIASYQIDYSKIFSGINELLKSLPSTYTQEEIEQIISRVQLLAENGWVIYFRDRNVYQCVLAEEWNILEKEWVELLREILRDEDSIIGLQNSQCYSAPLVKSMVDCYLNQNYYAAYTLGSLAIDGALNRISEIISSRKKIPVGYKAVEEIDAIFIDKSFSDIGLMHWLYNFFKDTKRFTLDEPNRHMVGHGRWEKEIDETDFLKLFNTLLYICDEYDYWAEIIETLENDRLK